MLFDLCVVLVLLIFAIRSYRAGLRGELVGVTGWVLTILLAFAFNDNAAVFMEKLIASPDFRTISNYFTFLLLLFIMRLLLLLVLRIAPGEKEKGGFVFSFLAMLAGLFRGAFFLSVLFLLILNTPMQERVDRFTAGSFTYKYAQNFSRQVVHAVTRYIPNVERAMQRMTSY